MTVIFYLMCFTAGILATVLAQKAHEAGFWRRILRRLGINWK